MHDICNESEPGTACTDDVQRLPAQRIVKVDHRRRPKVFDHIDELLAYDPDVWVAALHVGRTEARCRLFPHGLPMLV